MPSNTRRDILRLVSAGAACAVVRPERILGANDRIRVGVIGAGGRGRLLIEQLPSEQAEVVAAADCWLPRATEYAAKTQAKWDIYPDYRRILDRKDKQFTGLSHRAPYLYSFNKAEYFKALKDGLNKDW